MAPTYEAAVCEANAVEPLEAETTVSRSAETGRRPQGMAGIFGVFHRGWPGDCEYTDEPTMVRALIENRPNRDCDC